MVRRFSFQLNRRLSALTRRRVGLSLQDGELWAGGMSRPAGFSPGRGACARGGCSARRCFALARRNDIPLYRIVNCAAARRLCLPDIVPAQGYRARGAVRRGDVVLSVCLAFGSCRACVPIGMSRVRFVPGVRSYRNVLRSIHAGRAFLSECPAFDHACCLPHSAKQDGLRYLAFLFRRVEIAIRAFSDRRCGYPALWVHFGLARFFMAIPTENERNEGTRRTESAARRLCAFARAHWP